MSPCISQWLHWPAAGPYTLGDRSVCLRYCLLRHYYYCYLRHLPEPFNPLRQIIDAANGSESKSIGRFLESSGLFNPEFNNAWGIAAPLSEGVVWGCAYWALWGFVSTRLYRRAIRPDTDAFSLAMFGLVTAGLVDASRVNCLGTVHILLPLGLLWFGRRLASE